MTLKSALSAVAIAALAWGPPAIAADHEPTRPAVDHHQHLLSPAAAALNDEGPLAAVVLPPELDRLLRGREAGWNKAAALAGLYAGDAVVFDTLGRRWVRGRTEVADYMSSRFARAYTITPVAYHLDGSAGDIVGYFTRGDGAAAKHFGNVLMSIQRSGDGAWRIAAESPTFPGPATMEPVDAAQLVALMDEAGIRRAVVLSLAYWFASPLGKPQPDEQARVQAENDWTAAQVARFPDRLVGFCSVNPLKAYAADELGRCVRVDHLKGLKLHLGNSDVDLKKPEQAEALRRVVAEANRLGMPIVIHLWTDPSYGRAEAQVLLDSILPAAPDVTVQIAHMAGGGPGWTDEAFEVFATAVAAHDPRTRHLYFDIATVADSQTWEQLQLMAKRIRQVGVERILYGSDAAFGGRSTPRQEWGAFRGSVPLTDAEFRAIAANVAPYLR